MQPGAAPVNLLCQILLLKVCMESYSSSPWTFIQILLVIYIIVNNYKFWGLPFFYCVIVLTFLPKLISYCLLLSPCVSKLCYLCCLRWDLDELLYPLFMFYLQFLLRLPTFHIKISSFFKVHYWLYFCHIVFSYHTPFHLWILFYLHFYMAFMLDGLRLWIFDYLSLCN